MRSRKTMSENPSVSGRLLDKLLRWASAFGLIPPKPVRRRPCCAHPAWHAVGVEIARDGGEAIDLDRCEGCGTYRLSWWWPKDSADTKMGGEMDISGDLARRLRETADWEERRRLLRDVL